MLILIQEGSEMSYLIWRNEIRFLINLYNQVDYGESRKYKAEKRDDQV